MTDTVVKQKPIASVRITKSDAETLAKSLLRFKYNENTQEYKDLLEERKVLVNDIIDSVITPNMKEKIDAIPTNWLPKLDRLQVSFTGGGHYYRSYEHLYINGEIIDDYSLRQMLGFKRMDDVEIRVPECYTTGAFATFEARDPISSRWTDHDRKITKFKEDVHALYRQTLNTIKSASTTKKLVEIWPEIEPFVRARYGDGESKIKLPMVIVPTADLNAKLGLPITEDA